VSHILRKARTQKHQPFAHKQASAISDTATAGAVNMPQKCVIYCIARCSYACKNMSIAAVLEKATTPLKINT
jgi:hypothetical protein